ncbi:hypothetical protein MUN74_13240 [Agromyces endophyticus]|uniref:hypothetical protein n=1 Tax=Agromyces sp. H17E-10 TaxID=2932244 RepID=UPI001FD42242|nr:hypothetical protein [Agromyces sp. H17E-10]UOQ88245.1 hypothetical protein MUN74_13240 [Agromyces sp. H17E-10]
MRLEIDAPNSSWVRVPADAADGEGAATWAGEVVAGFRRRHPDTAAERLAAVRTLAQQAPSRVLPGAAVGLLYLPGPGAVGLIASIGVADPSPIEGSLAKALLGDAELEGRPVVDPIDVAGLGSGIAVRCRFAPQPGLRPAAGLAYLLQGERATVRVMVSPAPEELVAHAAPSLDAIVRSLRVVD